MNLDVRVETVVPASRYERRQMVRAVKVAALLAMICSDDRGVMVLLEPPAFTVVEEDGADDGST